MADYYVTATDPDGNVDRDYVDGAELVARIVALLQAGALKVNAERAA